MMDALIVFPEWLRPEIFTIGPFELGGREWAFPIRWYALAYIAGLIAGWRYVIGMIRNRALWAPKSAAKGAEGAPVVTEPQIDDFFVWAVLGVIVGGRLGSVLFYSPDMIWTDPLRILVIWQGGMSFHGGLIGVTAAILWFSRRQRINPVRLGDLIAPAVPIGLGLGRIANFINAELWGRPAEVPWAVVFCNDNLRNAFGECVAGDMPRHPSQLYEAAMEGIILFVILLVAVRAWKSLTRPGFNIGVFMLGYGVIRIVLETVREPDIGMPDFPLGLTMGMMLSIPMLAVGGWLVWRAAKKPPMFARPDAESAPAP